MISQETIGIVRTANDAFNRGDFEACLSVLDPGVEWWPAEDEPITEPYRGHDGFRRLVAQLVEVCPDIQSEIEELFVVDQRVVACLRYWGTGRESGAPVEVRETHVVRLRAGKIIEVREYREKSQALEALSLGDERQSRRRAGCWHAGTGGAGGVAS